MTQSNRRTRIWSWIKLDDGQQRDGSDGLVFTWTTMSIRGTGVLPNRLHRGRRESKGVGGQEANEQHAIDMHRSALCCKASFAPIMRPVRTNSIVRDLPIRFARRWVPPPPGMTPRLISGFPSCAEGEMRRMSAWSTSSRPLLSYDRQRKMISGSVNTYRVATDHGDDRLI